MNEFGHRDERIFDRQEELTPLMMSARQGSLRVVKYLLTLADIDVNVVNTQKPTFFASMYHGNYTRTLHVYKFTAGSPLKLSFKVK